MERLLEATARAEHEHFWFRGFRAFTGPILDLVAPAGRAPRILDAGCGTGHNLAALTRRGPAMGVDLSWRGLEFARQRPERLRLAQANLARLPFPDGRFDLVTCFDILQCVADVDEAAAAAELCRVLVPGGHVLITVAAIERLRGAHSVLTHEVRRYRRAGLRQLVGGTGLEIVRLTYAFFTLLPLIAGVRLLWQVGGLPVSDEDAAAARESAVPAWPINSALGALVAVEGLALRRMNLPIGTTLVCLARKPDR
jgi:SAM-dependent methyltransferase